MATWWTITVPPQFQDITAEAMQSPPFKAGLDRVRAEGGSINAQLWQGDESVLIVLDSTFADMPNTMSTLNGFEEGARKTSYGSGKEISHSVENTPYFLIGHQHATGSAGDEMWIQRWTGRGTDGALHSLGVICTGTEAKCKPLLATVKTDSKTFVALSSLGDGVESSQAYRIGYAVGGGMVCVFLVYALFKARQRSRVA